MDINVELWHLIVAVAVVGVINYLGVFLALATLRWRDAAQKRSLANIFMQEMGEKIRTEQEFRDIVNRSFERKEEEGE